jgi:hypothetical protein
MLIHGLVILALLALGFGAGRVHHPANLKVANIKIEIANFEATLAGDAKAVIAKIKAIL